MRRAVVLGVVALAALPPATTRAGDDFYKGRQIAWILSADAGGGYASYARAFAPFFSSTSRAILASSSSTCRAPAAFAP
jgi:hypothetical protein